MFELPIYNAPNFSDKNLSTAPDAVFAAVDRDGVAPDGFLATSIYPTYVKVSGDWKFIKKIRMDCVVTLLDGEVYATEFRRLKKGDLVLTGRTEDGTDGIYVNYQPFPVQKDDGGNFSCRQNRTRETSYSQTYDELYEVLRRDKENGNIVWVMGPATVFDHDSRTAFAGLIEKGYVNGVLAGNAFGTHDLEAAYFHTALGQDIYTKKSVFNGHYHHLEILNKARKSGSIAEFIKDYGIKDGAMYALEKNKVPYVLAGSIRDDGPLPPVYANAYEAQNAMRNIVENATTEIGRASCRERV